MLIVMSIKDRKDIYFISTIHKANTVRVRKRGTSGISASKLALVSNYSSKSMGVVDCKDALIGNCSLVQKTYKWTVKVVIHFIEEAVLNSFIFYDKVNPGKIRFMQCKLDIVEKTINRAGQPIYHKFIMYPNLVAIF